MDLVRLLFYRDKVALVEEIARLRDARVKNKGNQHTKVGKWPVGTFPKSEKERMTEAREKKKSSILRSSREC